MVILLVKTTGKKKEEHIYETRQIAPQNTTLLFLFPIEQTPEKKLNGAARLYIVFLPFYSSLMISKVGHSICQLNGPSFFSNLVFVKITDALFVLNWLFTVIYNDKTIVRTCSYFNI